MEPKGEQVPKPRRPWLHPGVQAAQGTYGIRFKSNKDVHQYESALQKKGLIDDASRSTCASCAQFKSDHKEGHAEQGMLF